MKKTILESYIEKVFNILGDEIINKLTHEQIHKISKLSGKFKKKEKKSKNILLEVTYRDWQDGYFEINGERVQDSGRVELAVTLDILEHLGYSVTFKKKKLQND